MQKEFDIIVIGAGFAGIVMAERFASVSGKRVLVIERKLHPGGHCRDFMNDHGIIIHEHGPHIFHTRDRMVWEYLSQFTEWHSYRHEVRALVDGELIPLPFNLNSLDMAFPGKRAKSIKEALAKRYDSASRVPVLELKSHTNSHLRELGEYVYKKVFLNYTMKQWGGKSPEELPPSVTSRVPVVLSRDDSYFSDPYQGIPKNGYGSMFAKMLNNKNIQVMTGIDAVDTISVRNRSIIMNGKPFAGLLIFTGMIDELFGFRYGRLPYRSLRLELEDVEVDRYQEYAVVNFPNENAFTRITEYKHFQSKPPQEGPTTICREYPAEYIPGENDPYYIIPDEGNMDRLARYQDEIRSIPNLLTVGRLAEYRYYNMDEVVSRSLLLFGELVS